MTTTYLVRSPDSAVQTLQNASLTQVVEEHVEGPVWQHRWSAQALLHRSHLDTTQLEGMQFA